jgi:tRNA (guanine-N7-)-methyltransferase
MRLRRKPDAEEILFHHPLVIDDVENSKGKWKDCFKNDQPIHVEFGMGKGTFITQMAKKNPHINYIGIERMATVLLGAAKKCDEYIPN